MLVTFKDGVTMPCSNPTEQKLFKNGAAAGWLCAIVILGEIGSSRLDNLLTADNISTLVFRSDEGEEFFSIDGYDKVSSVVIRHSEASGGAEIQLSKGV